MGFSPACTCSDTFCPHTRKKNHTTCSANQRPFITLSLPRPDAPVRSGPPATIAPPRPCNLESIGWGSGRGERVGRRSRPPRSDHRGAPRPRRQCALPGPARARREDRTRSRPRSRPRRKPAAPAPLTRARATPPRTTARPRRTAGTGACSRWRAARPAATLCSRQTSTASSPRRG